MAVADQRADKSLKIRRGVWRVCRLFIFCFCCCPDCGGHGRRGFVLKAHEPLAPAFRLGSALLCGPGPAKDVACVAAVEVCFHGLLLSVGLFLCPTCGCLNQPVAECAPLLPAYLAQVSGHHDRGQLHEACSVLSRLVHSCKCARYWACKCVRHRSMCVFLQAGEVPRCCCQRAACTKACGLRVHAVHRTTRNKCHKGCVCSCSLAHVACRGTIGMVGARAS